MNETGFFKHSEFACPCCGKIVIDMDLLNRLNRLRKEYNKPIRITSGYRCPAHNKAVGGVPNSTHQAGLGADIAPVQNDVDEFDVLLDLCKKHFWNVGNGISKGFLHVDSRRPRENENGKKIMREWIY